MATKIETDLTPEQLMEFFRRCAQTRGGATGPGIQAIAAEFGVVISHETANEYRKGIVASYLKRIEANASRAKEIVETVKAGVQISDANAVRLQMAISDKLDDLEEAEDVSTKELNTLSLANARIRMGDQRAVDLERKLADSEAARENAAQRLALLQFDAAAAAIKHAKEIRAVLADKTIDDSSRTERIRAILFGAPPADFRPVDTKGAQPEAGEAQP